MASPGDSEVDTDRDEPIADDRSSRFKMPWFLSKTAVISGAVILTGALAAAIALPSFLHADAQPTASQDPKLQADYDAALESFRAAQSDFAEANCAAEEDAIEAGLLAVPLEEALDHRDAIANDGALLGEAERASLVAAMDQAISDVAGLGITDRLRELVDQADARSDCSAVEPMEVPTELTGEATAEKITTLEERTAALHEDREAIEPIGPAVDQVTTIIDTLAEPTINAVDLRSPDSYFSAVYWAASEEAFAAFNDAASTLTGARDSFNETPEATVTLLAALGDQADVTAELVASHETAVNEETVPPGNAGDPGNPGNPGDPGDPEVPGDNPPNDPSPSNPPQPTTPPEEEDPTPTEPELPIDPEPTDPEV